MPKQQTIASSVRVSGVGLHTGVPVNMVFKPAPADHGLVFQRVDMPEQPLIHALSELVIDTSRGTTLEEHGARVHTVEHTLAALRGFQIDNALIELDGPEPPAMDGSSKAFSEALQQAGIAQQQAERQVYVIKHPIVYEDSQRKVKLEIQPADRFEAQVHIDFDSPTFAPQEAVLPSLSKFPLEFADSRTFCFLREVEPLLQQGLIKGGTLDSAVVIVDEPVSEQKVEHLRTLFEQPNIQISEEGVLNQGGFRYPNEPARHKLLDLVGDLALAGMPIHGKVIAHRPGHKANVALAQKIRTEIKQQQIKLKFQQVDKQGIIFDINAIQQILPHRYPFLLVDRVIDFSEKKIVGVKNVTINEPFFQGHFPGNPIMPGVLQLEAMAQVGGILLLNTIDNPQTVWVYIAAIDKARFKKPVVPGDIIHFELELVNLRKSICEMKGKAIVDGQLVCSANMLASIVPKNKL